MDDNTLKQTLRAIGQEAVPDDWNRWDEIQRRVQEETIFKRRPAPSRRWLKRVAALLIVMLISSGAIYAFVQVNLLTSDSGLIGAVEDGLVTDLNLVQTTDGVQVQLNWAYIDESRAVLNYQTFLVSGDETRSMADADAPTIVRLGERGGHLPDLYPDRFNARHYPNPVTVEFFLPKQNASLKDISGTVDLRLEIVYTERPRIRNLIEKILYPRPRALNDWGPPENHEPLPPDALSFTFDFTLPVPHAVTLEPMLTVTASDVAMTLESLRVSPSQVDFSLTYQIPPGDGRYWYTENITLKVNGIETDFLSGGEGDRTAEGHFYQRGFFNAYTEFPATVTLTVEALGRFPTVKPDEVLAVQREMALRGIAMWVEIKSNGQVGGFRWPVETDEERAALVELGYRIEGPWIFTIDVPAPDAE